MFSKCFYFRPTKTFGRGIHPYEPMHPIIGRPRFVQGVAWYTCITVAWHIAVQWEKDSIFVQQVTRDVIWVCFCRERCSWSQGSLNINSLHWIHDLYTWDYEDQIVWAQWSSRHALPMPSSTNRWKLSRTRSCCVYSEGVVIRKCECSRSSTSCYIKLSAFSLVL